MLLYSTDSHTLPIAPTIGKGHSKKKNQDFFAKDEQKGQKKECKQRTTVLQSKCPRYEFTYWICDLEQGHNISGF